MSIRTKLIFAAIGIAVNAGSSNAQDLCKFLPANPQILASATREVPLWAGGCLGGYWPRVATPVFYDLAEFGGTIMIWPMPSADEAKALAAKYQKGRPPTTTYGDGNWETMEDPKANDERARDPRSLASRSRGGTTMEELLSRRPYFNIFTCGNLIASIGANPSKGIAARDLVKELELNLRAAGLCGATATIVNNTATPPKGEATDGGNKVFEGEIARQILEWGNTNARYMVVLDRRWDAARNCWVEERAFAGGIRGSGSDQVSVSIGPSKSFCLDGKVYSAADVNATQKEIAKARDDLATALKNDERFEVYVRNHPTEPQAKRDYDYNKKLIDYYKKLIAYYENALSNSVPPQ